MKPNIKLVLLYRGIDFLIFSEIPLLALKYVFLFDTVKGFLVKWVMHQLTFQAFFPRKVFQHQDLFFFFPISGSVIIMFHCEPLNDIKRKDV